MKKFLFVVLIILFYQSLFAQYDNYSAGAKSKALSDASLTFSNLWAVFNNQAAMAFSDNKAIGVFAENKFGLKELNTGALAFTYPLEKAGVLGLSIYSFNQSVLFSRQKFGLAYALKLGNNFSSGMQLNLIRSFTAEYGSAFSFCGEIGLYFKMNEKTSLGVHVFNPTSSRYNKSNNERIPTLMRIGLAYQISENSILLAELENSSINSFNFKGGLVYQISERLSMRASVKSYPFASAFGLEISTKKININLALQFHQVLDISPGISLDHYFEK